MPLKNDVLEIQLKRAQEELNQVTAKLGDQVPKKNPDWRRANSRVQQIEGRIKSRKTIAEINSSASESEEN
jgi:hypothetical protein